jgi:fructosamine-3-kinase
VIGVGELEGGQPFLALEWVEGGGLSPEGAESLGRELAQTHRAGAPGFGSRPEAAAGSRLHIGPLVLADNESSSWPEFYAEQRLLATARIASDREALSGEEIALIERVCDRIDYLAGPAEPPARLHGDLWSGNVMAGADGAAVLVDPASYGGHREVDLAMLRLFGAPDERIFAAYGEVWPPADGAGERVRLYQLFPLLVHAALFGGGWGRRAAALARAYV